MLYEAHEGLFVTIWLTFHIFYGWGVFNNFVCVFILHSHILGYVVYYYFYRGKALNRRVRLPTDSALISRDFNIWALANRLSSLKLWDGTIEQQRYCDVQYAQNDERNGSMYSGLPNTVNVINNTFSLFVILDFLFINSLAFE